MLMPMLAAGSAEGVSTSLCWWPSWQCSREWFIVKKSNAHVVISLPSSSSHLATIPQFHLSVCQKREDWLLLLLVYVYESRSQTGTHPPLRRVWSLVDIGFINNRLWMNFYNFSFYLVICFSSGKSGNLFSPFFFFCKSSVKSKHSIEPHTLCCFHEIIFSV